MKLVKNETGQSFQHGNLQRAELHMNVSKDGRTASMRISNTDPVSAKYFCDLMTTALAAFILENGGDPVKAVAILECALKNIQLPASGAV